MADDAMTSHNYTLLQRCDNSKLLCCSSGSRIAWAKLEEAVGPENMKRFKDQDGNGKVDMEDVWIQLDYNRDGELTIDELTLGLLGRPKLQMEVYACFSDETGLMPIEEIGNAVRAMGYNPSDTEIFQLEKDFNKNSNQKIDKGEWNGICENLPEPDDDELREQIKYNFDIVAKGAESIPLKELEFMTTRFGMKLSEKELQAMLREVDINGDGRVDYTEFLNMRGEPEVSPF
eukprot:m.300072 g.300072  ORF g.300072 m.300072 type:complete len:232 (+) comp16418_c2_seq41:455-1150(+)